ncbi:hypothetical protein GW17_00059969 [Ensete ventricosum]|nr:hypothetical protein GW17_00059969 [Ensete ventricosum]
MYCVVDLVTDDREASMDDLGTFVLENIDHLMEREALVHTTYQKYLQVRILVFYFKDWQWIARTHLISGRAGLHEPSLLQLFDPFTKIFDVRCWPLHPVTL